MSNIFCPNCYSQFEVQPEKCECGYPFSGNEVDRYKFMSMRKKEKETLHEAQNYASYSRYILFIIGGINLLISLIMIFYTDDNSYYLITMLYSAILIGLGFYSYKEPFLALLSGFIVLILIYVIFGVLDPKKLLNGLALKIIFISSFIYGLIKIKLAENINKNK